ncbi:MAG: glycosyltransferase family 2 protein [Candidatus Gastranaerophilales bacterium]|nr:glycosyltransferase family 2 protein [Candidatus Gastranaerophilales bacterium]
MRVLVLLAGSSEQFFNKGFNYPKYLIEILGKPMIEHVIDNLKTIKNAQFTFVTLKDDCRKFHLDNVINLLIPDAKVIQIEKIAKGAACSALLAIEDIDNDKSLLIINGDQIIDIDISDAINKFKKDDLDGGIITFNSVHPRWSYVRLDEKGYVIETAEKRPISMFATSGAYYFKNGHDFVNAAMKMIEKDANVNDLYYICPSYNEMILNQALIGTYHIEREKYLSLASVDGVKHYEKYLGAKNA